MELLLPTQCNKSSSVLEVKCYHFVPHTDAVVIEVHAPQFICCPYDTVAVWVDA